MIRQNFLEGSCSSGFAPANRLRGFRRRSPGEETNVDTAVALSLSQILCLTGIGYISRDAEFRCSDRIRILWGVTTNSRFGKSSTIIYGKNSIRQLYLIQPHRDDLRYSRGLHRNPVESLGGFHCALVVGDHDKLRSF
jgi:hypothetical protein